MNWTLTVKQHEDSEDLYIEFPEEVLNQLGWKEGDDLIWEGNNNTYYVRKKDAPIMDEARESSN